MIYTINQIDKLYNLPVNTVAGRIKKLYKLKKKEDVGIVPALLEVKEIKIDLTETGRVKIDLSHRKTKIFVDTLASESWKQIIKLSYYR